MGGRVVIPSGSRGIPKKLPLSFRDGIARLSLGMAGVSTAFLLFVTAIEEVSSAADGELYLRTMRGAV